MLAESNLSQLRPAKEGVKEGGEEEEEEEEEEREKKEEEIVVFSNYYLIVSRDMSMVSEVKKTLRYGRCSGFFFTNNNSIIL